MKVKAWGTLREWAGASSDGPALLSLERDACWRNNWDRIVSSQSHRLCNLGSFIRTWRFRWSRPGSQQSSCPQVLGGSGLFRIGHWFSGLSDTFNIKLIILFLNLSCDFWSRSFATETTGIIALSIYQERAHLPTLCSFSILNVCPDTDQKKTKKHFFKKEKAQRFLRMVMNRHAGEGVPSTGCVIVFPRFTLKRGNILLTLLFHCHGVEKSKQHWKGYDCRWKQTEKSLNGTSIHLFSKDLWKSLTNTELHNPQTDS